MTGYEPVDRRPTHRVWSCPNCETTIWLPVGAVDVGTRHKMRLFCATCAPEQGCRMSPEPGADGRVSL